MCSRCACHWALVWTPHGPLGRGIERQLPVTALPSHIKRDQRAKGLFLRSNFPQTQLHGPGHVRLNARPGLCSRSACHWALVWGSRKPPGPAIETQVPVHGVTNPRQARTKGCFGVKIPKPRCHLPCYARLNTRPGCALAAHVTRPSYGRPVGLWAGILRGRCLFKALPSHIKREQREVFEVKNPPNSAAWARPRASERATWPVLSLRMSLGPRMGVS
jgi:hypothetical protein